MQAGACIQVTGLIVNKVMWMSILIGLLCSNVKVNEMHNS